MEQMAKYYYWNNMQLGARTAATSSSLIRSWPPPARAGGEPSWEEMAFARDAAAGHLVWPPRSYTCTFCRREFRSAQALGGHMNVHRRDRARLRQSPRIAPPPAAADHHHHHHLMMQAESPASCLFRAKPQAVLISGPKLLSPAATYCDDHQTNYNKADPEEEALISSTSTTSPRPYISTIIKESETNKQQLVISIPAAPAAGSKQALAATIIDDEEEEAEKRKRRRVDQPLFFLRPLIASSKGGVERRDDSAKVPKVVITSPSPNSLHLAAGRQEVDLELRLGANPNELV